MPARARPIEVLYESGRTRVSRIWDAAGTSSHVAKQALGRGGLERTRHELSILRRLAGVPGVVQLSPGAEGIMLEDVGGVTLTALIGNEEQTSEQCVEFALELALTVAAIHRAGVIHKDINPSNIVVSGGWRKPVLIDFDLASTFEDHPTFAHHRQIIGTLPYLAPEQTGRTGMAVDGRADLYALGATIYQVATANRHFRRATRCGWSLTPLPGCRRRSSRSRHPRGRSRLGAERRGR